MAKNDDVVQGVGDFFTGTSQYNQLSFMIRQTVMEMLNTSSLVAVNGVEGGGKDKPAGYVSATPLVAQTDAQGNALPMAKIPKLRFFRYQAGKAAIILDPVPGDQGVAVFFKNDSSGVKDGETKAVTPGSFRNFDQSDGVVLGGVQNQKPTVWLELGQDEKITIHGPEGAKIESDNAVKIDSKTAEISASQEMKITSDGIKLEGPITAGGRDGGAGSMQFSGTMSLDGSMDVNGAVGVIGSFLLNGKSIMDMIHDAIPGDIPDIGSTLKSVTGSCEGRGQDKVFRLTSTKSDGTVTTQDVPCLGVMIDERVGALGLSSVAACEMEPVAQTFEIGINIFYADGSTLASPVKLTFLLATPESAQEKTFSVNFGADGRGGVSICYPYDVFVPTSMETRTSDYFMDATIWRGAYGTHYAVPLSNGCVVDTWLTQDTEHAGNYGIVHARLYGPKAESPRMITLMNDGTSTVVTEMIAQAESATAAYYSDGYVYPYPSGNTRLYRGQTAAEPVALSSAPYVSPYLSVTVALAGSDVIMDAPADSAAWWPRELAGASITTELSNGASATADLACLVGYISTEFTREDDAIAQINNTLAQIKDYTGATASASGVHGLVPAALSSERNNLLAGSGDWVSVTDALGYTPANDAGAVHTTGAETIAGAKTFTSDIVGSITGNAATATQFESNATVALTGDATGTSAGSKKGWSVPVTLANSGVTAGSYGPSADASPAQSGSFSVPYLTVDAKGRVTAASTKSVTLPGLASTSADGFMSSTDKSNLDGLSQYPRITYIAARSSSDSVAQNTADWGLSESAPTKVHFYSGKGIHTATNRSTDKQTITVYHGVAPDEIAGDGITVNNYIMSVPEYEGATAVANGTSGLVPPALIAEKDKLLTGSGDWISVADALGYAPANDANVVHTSGNETIDGTKTFNTTIFGAINSTVALSSQIKSNETYRDIGQVTDSDGNRVGLIRALKAADGTRNITVTAVKSDNTIAGSIAVQTDADGNTYATAPNTLATRTGGSDIITRGYLNSADSGVVHTSGNETIAGTKTFTDSPTISISSGTAVLNLRHGSDQYGDIRFQDDAGATYGVIRKNASNASLQIGFRCANGTSWQQGPRITLAAGGAWSLLSNDATNAYMLSCSATGNLTFNGPEPAASSDNTQLATTQWVRDATGDFACNAATAGKLSSAQSLKTKLDSTTAVTFDGSSAQDAIPVTGVLPVANGGTGRNGFSYDNGIIYIDNASTPSALKGIATKSGALYATANNGVAQFGTLPVAQGGTGQTSVASIKAGKDADGNTITTTYATKTELGAKADASSLSSYLPLSGGTMTGTVTMSGAGANKAFAVTNGTYTTRFIIGDGGVNRGLYDATLAKWMVYANASDVYLKGNADTATRLAAPRTISVGGKEYVGSASFDGSGNVSLNVMPCFATSYSGSSRTLPYHLLASCTLTGNSLTRSIVFLVTRTHTDLGNCGDGIFSLTLRANSAGNTGAIRAKWLCRTSDLDENAIQIGYNLVSGNVYADVFVYDKATYMATTFRVLSQSTAYNGIGSSSFTLTDAMQTSASATTGGCYATLDDAAQALRGVGSGNSYPYALSPS